MDIRVFDDDGESSYFMDFRRIRSTSKAVKMAEFIYNEFLEEENLTERYMMWYNERFPSKEQFVNRMLYEEGFVNKIHGAFLEYCNINVFIKYNYLFTKAEGLPDASPTEAFTEYYCKGVVGHVAGGASLWDTWDDAVSVLDG